MAEQCYSVIPHPVETSLVWVKSGEISMPEIQLPFILDSASIRILNETIGDTAENGNGSVDSKR